MKRIDISTPKHPLTFTLVDDDDYMSLNSVKWGASEHAGDIYAIRSVLVDGKYTSESMHRVIMNTPDDMVVDHIFHDTLDNRKAKLRNCTDAENSRNQVLAKNNKSGYKGVWWDCDKGRWVAYITLNRKRSYLGVFKVLEDAATAYDLAAIKLHGNFAFINNIDYINQKQPLIDRYHYLSMPRGDTGAYGDESLIIRRLVNELSTRERMVIKAYFGIDDSSAHSCEAIGVLLNLSRQGVDIIKNAALTKLAFRLK